MEDNEPRPRAILVDPPTESASIVIHSGTASLACNLDVNQLIALASNCLAAARRRMPR